MAYTVTQLITEAYYLSGRVSQGLQTVSGQQLNQGLNLLNSILATNTVDERLIPYFTKYDFNTIVGQESYFIPSLIMIETLTFNYSQVRWSVEPTTRKYYQGSSRANNIESLMMNYYVERGKGGATIFFYFLPDQIYPVTIWAKFSLSQVVLNQDLSAILEIYYINYLRYALAEYICHANNITFQPQNSEELKRLEKVLLDTSAPDLTIQNMSGLKARGQSIWGLVNLSRGWGLDE